MLFMESWMDSARKERDGGVGAVFCFVFVLVIIHHIIFNWHAFYIQELQGSIKAWME
jgi:hypothetical protein